MASVFFLIYRAHASRPTPTHDHAGADHAVVFFDHGRNVVVLLFLSHKSTGLSFCARKTTVEWKTFAKQLGVQYVAYLLGFVSFPSIHVNVLHKNEIILTRTVLLDTPELDSSVVSNTT